MLRKDFIVDPYQLYEARGRRRRRGAADRRRARAATSSSALLREARALDLDVLVEVHDERELEPALEVDADVHRHQQPRPRRLQRRPRAHATSCSPTSRPARPWSRSRAIRTREQLDELERVGVDAVLIGETLMRAADVEAACRALTGSPRLNLEQRRFLTGVDGARPHCAAMTSPKRAPFLAFVSALLGGAIVAVLLVAFGAVGSNSTTDRGPAGTAVRAPSQRRGSSARPDRRATSTSATPPASSSSAPTSSQQTQSPFDTCPAAQQGDGHRLRLRDRQATATILTNAHVVAGATKVTRRVRATSKTVPRPGGRQGPVQRPRAAQGRPRQA